MPYTDPMFPGRKANQLPQQLPPPPSVQHPTTTLSDRKQKRVDQHQISTYLSPLLALSSPSTILTPSRWKSRSVSNSPSIYQFIGTGVSGSAIRMRSTKKDIVFKIMRIANIPGQASASSLMCPTVEQIVDEVRALQTLSGLLGFVRFHGMSLVRGTLGELLGGVTVMKKRVKPLVRGVGIGEKGYFAVLEMDHGGEMAGNVVDRNTRQLRGDGDDRGKIEALRTLAALYLGILGVLANAEREAEYQQKDLHIGNVVVEFEESPLQTASTM